MFSEKIKDLRRQYCITQIKFAEAFNISAGTIAMWETGKRTPDIETIQKIAAYFNVSVDWLIGASDYKNEEEVIDYNWGTIGDFECAFDFAPLLAEIREEQDVSMIDMAKSIGATEEQYTEIENGILPITHEQAEILCKKLGTNVSQVLFDNELYDEYVPEEYHNDVRKWEIMKQYDDLDRQVAELYPDWVRGRNYLPSTACPDIKDSEILKKYRALDEHGKDMVDTVLDKEYSRCAEEAPRITAYTENMAAGTGSEGLTEKKIKEMEAFGKLVSDYENKSE